MIPRYLIMIDTYDTDLSKWYHVKDPNCNMKKMNGVHLFWCTVKVLKFCISKLRGSFHSIQMRGPTIQTVHYNCIRVYRITDHFAARDFIARWLPSHWSWIDISKQLDQAASRAIFSDIKEIKKINGPVGRKQIEMILPVHKSLTHKRAKLGGQEFFRVPEKHILHL